MTATPHNAAKPWEDENRTSNPHYSAQVKEWLRLEYERGRKDGYDETVRMIRRATQALQRDRKKAT